MASTPMSSFDELFRFNTNYRYPSTVIQQIEQSRQEFDGPLLFDRLLESIKGNVQQKKSAPLYPPADNEALRKLHRVIVKSDSSEILKQSILYYILKDVVLPAKRNGDAERDVASEFAGDCFLPTKYWTFIEGIWALDRQRYQEAMDHLTHPTSIPIFSEEILDILIQQNRPELAFAYYHTVSPPLTDPELLYSYFGILCKGSVTEAFYFSRMQPDSQRRALLHSLVSALLDDWKDVEARSARGVELVNLPFDKDEELWFEEYLTIDGRNRNHAADTLLMRKIVTGRLNEVAADVRTQPVSQRAHEGVSWENVLHSLERGMGPRKTVGIYDTD